MTNAAAKTNLKVLPRKESTSVKNNNSQAGNTKSLRPKQVAVWVWEDINVCMCVFFVFTIKQNKSHFVA